MILQKTEVVNCDLCLMFIIKTGVLSPIVLCVLKSYEPAEILTKKRYNIYAGIVKMLRYPPFIQYDTHLISRSHNRRCLPSCV